MSTTCAQIHELLAKLPRWSFPFQADAIPGDGIYLLVEDGEVGHGGDRIVRIGTHTGFKQLRSRLKQHFLNPNKDRSIFRKNIGRALLHREADDYLGIWNLDLTTRAARLQHGAKVDEAKQHKIEKEISAYIQTHFHFYVIPVTDESKRLSWESRLVSTVSLCSECQASAMWLGRNSPVAKIAESGLWQVNELYKEPFTEDELVEFKSALGA